MNRRTEFIRWETKVQKEAGHIVVTVPQPDKTEELFCFYFALLSERMQLSTVTVSKRNLSQRSAFILTNNSNN